MVQGVRYADWNVDELSKENMIFLRTRTIEILTVLQRGQNM